MGGAPGCLIWLVDSNMNLGMDIGPFGVSRHCERSKRHVKKRGGDPQTDQPYLESSCAIIL